MTKREKIIEILENLCTEDAVEIWNDYCEETNNLDDHIFCMEEFDEVFQYSTPTEIVELIGSFSTDDDYFTYGIYGVDSFVNIDECSLWFPVDVARYSDENDEDFGNDDIREILDEEECEDD